MKIALIADVHANLDALKAVLRDARQKGADEVWNAGDLTGYGPFPDETVRKIKKEKITGIIGNYDLKVLHFNNKIKQKVRSPLKRFAFGWARGRLSRPARKYLLSLPRELWLEREGKRILLTHGSPASMEEHLSEHTTEKRLKELSEMTDAGIVICSHSHRPFSRKINGVRFINPGSVGRPDDGDSRASYALMEIRKGCFRVRHLRIEYDTGAAVAAMRERKLPPEFARMVTEGRSLDHIIGKKEKLKEIFDSAKGGGDIRLRSVMKLSESCNYELEHARQVTRLSLLLFNRLQTLHGLGPEERFFLQCAALLHDIGFIEGPRAHHKTSLRLILESPVLALSREERLITGTIARYHRRPFPSIKHRHFAALGPEDRRRVRILSGILRLADAFDSSHLADVLTLSCRIAPFCITVECSVRGPHRELDAIIPEKAGLFEQVFKKKLSIKWNVLKKHILQRADTV